MVYLYVIQSMLDKGYYIGITKDIESRLKKHNAGFVFSTKKRKPFLLVHKESFEDYSQARVREKQIKSYKGGNSFKELIGM